MIQKIRNELKQQWVTYAGVVLAALVFACWYPLQYLLGVQQGFGAVIEVGSVFKSIYSWLPLVSDITQGNLFPISATFDPALKGLAFYPYITLWVYGLVVAIGGAPLTIAVFQLFFPVASFYLLTLIFRRYLTPLWSLALAFLAFMSFADLPFRDFLIGIVSGTSWLELGTVQPLEILSSPIPSFSVFAFLFLFYFSTPLKHLSARRVILLTVCWSLLAQVHAIDALFGLAFWFSYSLIRLYRQKVPALYLILAALFELSVALLCLAPTIYAYLHQDTSLLAANADYSVSFYYYAAYFLMPVSAMMLIYFVQRVDFYEIFFKFWHVYVLMLIEFMLVFAASHDLIGMSQAVLQNRIAFFFLHFYYYVPVIYFASRASQQYSFGAESSKLAANARKGIEIIFVRSAKYYLPIFILLLSVFATTSAYKNYQFHQDVSMPALAAAQKELHQLTFVYDRGEVLVTDSPAVNLLVTAQPRSHYASLWVNRFSNEVSLEEAIDSMALYAKIFQWTEERFLQFMLPGDLQKQRNAIVNLEAAQANQSGVGYWLMQHERVLTNEARVAYEALLKKRYQELNVMAALKRFKVKKVYSSSELTHIKSLYKSYGTYNGNVYIVN